MIMTVSAARALMRQKGLKLNYTGTAGDGDAREYYWYGDGSDALLDHSATLTAIGMDGGKGRVFVSLFGRAKGEAA